MRFLGAEFYDRRRYARSPMFCQCEFTIRGIYVFTSGIANTTTGLISSFQKGRPVASEQLRPERKRSAAFQAALTIGANATSEAAGRAHATQATNATWLLGVPLG